MATILQTTFWNTFSLMKMYENQVQFHWSLFLYDELKYSSTDANNGLVSNRKQAIIWSNDGWFIDAYMHYLVSMS